MTPPSQKQASTPRTARVLTRGSRQIVRLPAAFHLSSPEVYIRRDEATGDIILSPTNPSDQPKSWEELFTLLDTLRLEPSDFQNLRDKSLPMEEDTFAWSGTEHPDEALGDSPTVPETAR